MFVFGFLFCVAFVSVLFALFLVLWLDVIVLFLLFFCSFFGFDFFEGLRVRWGGPKGHLTWPQALLIFCFVFLFVFPFFCFPFCFLLFVFLGGFKGQARWPKGPPHLALNPSYSICFCFFVFCFFCFLVFAFARKTLFSPQKWHFCVFFLCLPLFLFSLVSLSPFSVSLSLSLSLSLSCSFLVSFLSVFHFCFWLLLFLFVLFAFFF